MDDFANEPTPMELEAELVAPLTHEGRRPLQFPWRKHVVTGLAIACMAVVVVIIVCSFAARHSRPGPPPHPPSPGPGPVPTPVPTAPTPTPPAPSPPSPFTGLLHTPLGDVLGVESGSVASWYGIPYAEPPVRFKPAESKTPWDGTLDASTRAQSCVQTAGDLMGTGSEDCLTVDVHRPLVLNSTPNHVIVYVGGKNFQEDSGRNLCPACLSRAINAIVVTVQYRLGILGFLAHEALASENPRWASTGGMNGFYDVIVALKWVNYNIVSWGGDPAGVTLMGASAGASLVAALIVNPLSQGLVSRAIVQSGSVYGPAVNDYDVDDANFTTTAFLKSCDVTTPIALRDTPLQTLMLASANFTFMPSLDNHLFRERVDKLWKQGDFAVQEIIIGVTTRDGGLVERRFGDTFPDAVVNATIYNETLTSFLPGNASALDELYTFYDATSRRFDSNWKVRNLFGLAVAWRDLSLLCPSYDMKYWATKAGVTTYAYLFGSSWSGGPITDEGLYRMPNDMPQGMQLPVVFGMGDEMRKNITFFELIEHTFGEQLWEPGLTYWDTFARHGVPFLPHPGQLELWDPVTVEDVQSFMFLVDPHPIWNGEVGALRPPTLSECNFWATHPWRAPHSQPVPPSPPPPPPAEPTVAPSPAPTRAPTRSPTLPKYNTISTPSGSVRGVWTSDSRVVTYLAVPYAEPPVGNARFAPAQPAVPWAGVRDATLCGPMCVQTEGEMKGQGEEDCLTLNVYTPMKPTLAGPLPVLFYIHAGRFVQGTACSGPLDPPQGDASTCAACLSSNEDIVVVHAQYRLGVLGFLALPELASEDPEFPSNGGMNGIFDLVVALRWVQQNIAAFGGDPGTVTVMGSGSGATAAAALVACPVAKDLMQRAIVEGGAVYGAAVNDFSQDAAVSTGQALLDNLVLQSVEGLRRQTVDDLIEASEDLRFLPSVDGVVFKSSVESFWRNGSLHVEQMLIGLNTLEDGGVVLETYRDWFPSGEMTGDLFNSTMEGLFNQTGASLDALDRMYPKSRFTVAGAHKNLFALVVAWRDMAFFCPSLNMRAWAVAGNVTTYPFFFGSNWPGGEGGPAGEQYLPPSAFEDGEELPAVYGMGVHMDENPSRFRMLNATFGADPSSPPAKYWASFIKQGRPALAGTGWRPWYQQWPQATRGDARNTAMYITPPKPLFNATPGDIVRAPTMEECQFWASHPWKPPLVPTPSWPDLLRHNLLKAKGLDHRA